MTPKEQSEVKARWKKKTKLANENKLLYKLNGDDSCCVNYRKIITSLRSLISFSARERMDRWAGRWAGTVRSVVMLFP